MDPFVILDLKEDASKAQIIKQVTQALRDKRYAAKTIAEAQKQLFDPLTRGVAEFRYHLDISACAGCPATAEAEQPPQLERLLLNRQGPEHDDKNTSKK